MKIISEGIISNDGYYLGRFQKISEDWWQGYKLWQCQWYGEKGTDLEGSIM